MDMAVTSVVSSPIFTEKPPAVSLVEAMKASSPTDLKSTPSSVLANEQTSWTTMLEQITNASKGKQIFMLLNYDGTLSPIVDDPDRAFMSEADYHVLEKKIESILVNYPKFHFTKGKMVFEIRPLIEWNKGNALEYLLDTFGFGDFDDDVLPIYIGDDKIDENAFKVLQKGGNGCPIIVSNTPSETATSLLLWVRFPCHGFVRYSVSG